VFSERTKTELDHGADKTKRRSSEQRKKGCMVCELQTSYLDNAKAGDSGREYKITVTKGVNKRPE